MGTFNTPDNTNSGRNWNVFNTKGPFKTVFLGAGRHYIELVITMTMDPWGIEIDQIMMWFGGRFTEQQLRCDISGTGTSLFSMFILLSFTKIKSLL